MESLPNFTFFFSFCLTGLVLLVVGYLVKYKPPKKINKFYGYRTKRSMQSQEAWDFAQPLSAKAVIYAGYILMICGFLCLLLEPIREEIMAVFFTSLVLVVTLGPILWIERELKRKFRN